jgi:predicted transcriptional regulator
LENPEVRAEYEALEEEYALIRQLIDLRIERGLSQRQLAKRAGMQQPVIARLEGGARDPTLSLDHMTTSGNRLRCLT